MRILFLGDIVGRWARNAIVEQLRDLKELLKIDMAIVNGENAAAGFGITEKIAGELVGAGVDVITGGNHSWDQKEALRFIDGFDQLLRPINYPDETPGAGFGVFESDKGQKVLIVNAMGRVFMDPLDDPFEAVDKVLKAHPMGKDIDAAVVDFHGEATSEKMAMGHFCDGRASLVVGTHSHVPTADLQILPKGTAYQTDAGMCGHYDSVIGMDKVEPLERFTGRIPKGRFQVAEGEPTLCGVVVETKPTGLAARVAPVRIGGRLSQTLPKWT